MLCSELKHLYTAITHTKHVSLDWVWRRTCGKCHGKCLPSLLYANEKRRHVFLVIVVRSTYLIPENLTFRSSESSLIINEDYVKVAHMPRASPMKAFSRSFVRLLIIEEDKEQVGTFWLWIGAVKIYQSEGWALASWFVLCRRLLCLNSGRRWVWWTLASCERRIPRWLTLFERWWLRNIIHGFYFQDFNHQQYYFSPKTVLVRQKSNKERTS